MRASSWVMLVLLAIGCRGNTPTREAEPRPAGPPSAAVAATSSATLEAGRPEAAAEDPGLPPLEGEEPLVALPVEGFRDAVVSLPLGATEPRPVVVALHGNYDRPEWQCEIWRGITGGHPFVLCPRGIPRGDAPRGSDRWTYGALGAVERELDAALAALATKYPNHVSDGPAVFTGFSLGAILGIRILAKSPDRFPRAVLTEGGYKRWTLGTARKFAEGGGRRVLFACGQSLCAQMAKTPKRWLEKAGAEVRIVSGGNVGHTYDGKVAEAIAAEWSWLLAPVQDAGADASPR